MGSPAPSAAVAPAGSASIASGGGGGGSYGSGSDIRSQTAALFEQKTGTAPTAFQLDYWSGIFGLDNQITPDEVARLGGAANITKEVSQITSQREAERIAAEEAARQRAEQETARQRAEQEAARQRAEQEAVRQRAEQEAARRRAAEQAALQQQSQTNLKDVALNKTSLSNAVTTTTSTTSPFENLDFRLGSQPSRAVVRPLVPKILYDKRGMAMIEGGTPYNPAQYGYPGAVIPAIPYPFSTDGTFVPVTPGGTQPPETQQPGGTQPPGTETPGGTTPDGTAPGGTTPGGTQAPISQDPNAYKYNYWDNSQEDNRLVKEFQTGSNPKARADLVELYLTKLGRLPDAAGFNYWLGEFGTEVDANEAKRFMDNAQTEINQRKSLESVYRDVAQRDVDIPGLEYWMGEIGRAGGIDPIKGAITAGLKKEIDMGNAGYSPAYTRDLLANLQNKTPEQISAENAKAPFLYGTIPGSQNSQYPAGRDNNKARAELYQLYKDNLGREPDLAGFDYWINTEGFGNDNVIDPQERSRFLERAKQLGEPVKMAYGGLAGLSNLGGYSDGGRLLKGPGDGVSDSIPAVIGNRQPARLADGEFVIPARIVSELGNGSTDAGARKLYAMMDRIQRARKKSTGKERVAVNSRAEKYLPA